MQRKKSSHFMILHLLLWVGLLQPDGFAERTLVRYEHGLKPIEQFVVGDHVIIVADGGQLQPYSIAQTMSYVADRFIKIQIKDICVCAAPEQKFYSCTRNDWVSAQSLQPSEQLLCGSGNVVCIDAVETVHKKQRMHTFSVETSHVFCVTPYEILAHNIEPVATTAGAVVILSAVTVACPPAGIALAIGKAVAFGVTGYVMYRIHRRIHNNRIKNEGCFTPESINGITKPTVTGCFQPVPDVPIVCDIKTAKQPELPNVLVNEIPQDIINKGNTDCRLPAEIPQPTLYHSATTQTDGNEKKRYDGPTYNRTEDWIKEHPFGQKIKDYLERTDYLNQGKRVFKVTKKIEGCNGFNKGDFVVIDALHNDHLEVFNKRGKWIRVANFDGTINHEKTTQGEKESRVPLS